MPTTRSSKSATPRPLSRVKRRKQPLTPAQQVAVRKAMQRHQQLKEQAAASSAITQPQADDVELSANDEDLRDFNLDNDDFRLDGVESDERPADGAVEEIQVSGDDASADSTSSKAESSKNGKRRQRLSLQELDRLPRVKARCKDCGHTVYYKTNKTFTVECSECGGSIQVKPSQLRKTLLVMSAVAIGGLATVGIVVAAAAGL